MIQRFSFDVKLWCFTRVLKPISWISPGFVGLSFPGLVLVFLFCSNFGLTPNIIHETHPGLEDPGILFHGSSRVPTPDPGNTASFTDHGDESSHNEANFFFWGVNVAFGKYPQSHDCSTPKNGRSRKEARPWFICWLRTNCYYVSSQKWRLATLAKRSSPKSGWHPGKYMYDYKYIYMIIYGYMNVHLLNVPDKCHRVFLQPPFTRHYTKPNENSRALRRAQIFRCRRLINKIVGPKKQQMPRLRGPLVKGLLTSRKFAMSLKNTKHKMCSSEEVFKIVKWHFIIPVG